MQKERLVLDTNILISSTFWFGDSYKIMKLIEDKKYLLIISEFIIKEYKKVLLSEEIIEKQEKKKLITNKIIKKLLEQSILINPKHIPKIVIQDPDDDNIIATAIAGKAGFIITQDNHLLKIKNYENIKIITPEEFLKHAYY